MRHTALPTGRNAHPGHFRRPILTTGVAAFIAGVALLGARPASAQIVEACSAVTAGACGLVACLPGPGASFSASLAAVDGAPGFNLSFGFGDPSPLGVRFGLSFANAEEGSRAVLSGLVRVRVLAGEPEVRTPLRIDLEAGLAQGHQGFTSHVSPLVGLAATLGLARGVSLTFRAHAMRDEPRPTAQRLRRGAFATGLTELGVTFVPSRWVNWDRAGRTVVAPQDPFDA